jgi:hypothetical protein
METRSQRLRGAGEGRDEVDDAGLDFVQKARLNPSGSFGKRHRETRLPADHNNRQLTEIITENGGESQRIADVAADLSAANNCLERMSFSF